MLTVAGSATHIAQPSHKLYQIQDEIPSSEPALPPNTGSLWRGLLEKTDEMIGRGSSRQSVRPLKRELTDQERQGVYMLLAILGGSWLLGGLLDTTKTGDKEDHP